MNDFLGMDLTRAEGFCDLLEERARAAEQSLEAVQSACADLPWFGEDSDVFREGWVTLQKRTITAIEALITKAKRLRDQIEQQRTASSARTGSVASMIGGASTGEAAASSQ